MTSERLWRHPVSHTPSSFSCDKRVCRAHARPQSSHPRHSIWLLPLRVLPRSLCAAPPSSHARSVRFRWFAALLLARSCVLGVRPRLALSPVGQDCPRVPPLSVTLRARLVGAMPPLTHFCGGKRPPCPHASYAYDMHVHVRVYQHYIIF